MINSSPRYQQEKPRDEVHVKHKSHMACLSSSMSLTFIMALHSSLEKQWVSPFFPINFLFLKKFFHLKTLGIL
jgi:hypothetical protein